MAIIQSLVLMYDNLESYPEEVAQLIKLNTVEEGLIRQQVECYQQSLQQMAVLDSMLMAAIP